MQYLFNERFDKSYLRLPNHIKTKIDKAIALFVQNPHHPSLQSRRLTSVPGLWYARVDRAHRFTFEYEESPDGETICRFRNVGPHDVIDRNP